MRASTVVMIGFAVVFGLLAVFIAQIWLNNQANQRVRTIESSAKPLATQTIVVAKQPLRFGTELSAAMLEEVAWPSKAMPAGAFAKISDVLSPGRRVVLAAVERNEPVLALKITGPGQRATLSALVKPGMKAVTIRVNDVEGVGGFVLPGDHVDVVLTRQIDKGQASSEVVLQDTRVLAVDQSADERTNKAAVAKSVTLEVSIVQAQKVWLASSVGSLSLLLRKAGETADVKTRKITLKDLESGDVANDKGATTTVVVMRPTAKQEYTVPVEATDTAVAEAKRKQPGL
ncbi:MAG TPA: Flp pilus assembly protein CpaB [Pseudolabrys sp.]|uniref:Flp pilus assembly protein CpaB n=1 Tax=Pseudolabrys sp. TaxID=1960880 RepID=UPI002DDD47C0|nr:Flp pilus assembly protein CpaB [Pseudolabrys sp.]HEV2629960.1 Flp pilus assembly protein CpaB [Pseudolabrys sp.]